MSTRTEREELSKQLKVLYTEKVATRDKIWALQQQLDSIAKVAKIEYYSDTTTVVPVDSSRLGASLQDVFGLVRRDFELTVEIERIDKKLLEQ